MNSIRIRNIVIAILALLNVILLALLLGRRAEENAARTRALRELVALCDNRGIRFSPDLLPEACAFSAIEPARDTAAERDFAAALLGGDVSADAVGGGIRRYAGDAGQCLLRASGAVESELDRPVPDADSFCDELFLSLGYERVSPPLDGADGTVEGVRALGGGAVFNAALTLRFEGGRLRAADGVFLPALAESEGFRGLDPISALVRFLDYSNVSGTVCTELTAIAPGYLLQSSAASPLRLSPAWRISTDVSDYYVNLMTGEVLRA